MDANGSEPLSSLSSTSESIRSALAPAASFVDVLDELGKCDGQYFDRSDASFGLNTLEM